MRVLVSGSSGLIGSALLSRLSVADHSVNRLVRPGKTPGPGDVSWDPAAQRIDLAALEGFDAVVHLAGENIAAGRWTPARKQRIRDSRAKSTRLLAEALAALARPPRALVAASAIGFYGDRGDEALTEESPAGSGFLPEVCQEWEAATAAAQKRIRVVNLRFGMVLAADGGALRVMVLPSKLGLGGPLGSGRQWVSWIARDDLLGIIQHAIAGERLQGPVNVVTPEPVTNRDFSRALGRVLHRPAIMPVPAFALRLTLGEMADGLLLASARVSPAKLAASGYRFLHPRLDSALQNLLRPGQK
jgi:uncharacterized protein (TIGR01777 family)